MLALALGKHLHEIESLPQRDLLRWMRFYSQEPFGLVRDDLRLAIVAQAASQPHTKKRLKVADFMPKFKRPRAKQSEKERALVAQQIIGWLTNANSRKS